VGRGGAPVVSGLPGLRAIWGRALEAFSPDADALVRSDGSTLSYAELSAAIDWSTNQLREAGAREGIVVGVSIADPAAFLIAALGAWECGAAVLPLDARAESLDSQAARIEDLAVRGHAALLAVGANEKGELQLQTRPGAGEIDPRCGLLLFTSGSSGPPKGVLLARTGLAANVDAILRYLPLRTSRRAAIVLPLTYSYALVGQALAGLRAGATLLMLGDLRYPALQLEAMARLGAQGLSAVPTLLKLLARGRLELGDANDQATPRFDYLASAGARLDAKTIELLRAAFPGARLFNQYGLTEASPRVAAIGDDHPAFARGAAGFPLEGIEAWAEDESGARLPAGSVGAICVRARSVMLGYLDDESATARTLTSEGVLRTGDVGSLDSEGILFIEGRGDGVVKIAGERVGVDGVAESLRGAAGVRDAAVIALADETLGAKLLAFIEGEVGALDAARAVGRSLAPARRPARIAQLEALPRTAHGKIDLAALRKLADESRLRRAIVRDTAKHSVPDSKHGAADSKRADESGETT